MRIERGSLNDRPGSPQRANRMPGHIMAKKSHAARCRSHKAQRHSNSGRLARAVLPEKTEDVPALNLQGDFIDGHSPAVLLCELLCLEHYIAHSHLQRHLNQQWPVIHMAYGCSPDHLGPPQQCDLRQTEYVVDPPFVQGSPTRVSAKVAKVLQDITV